VARIPLAKTGIHPRSSRGHAFAEFALKSGFLAMRVGVTLAILMATRSAAFAGGGFEIVIPGRAGVPVIINGIDASYAVVEGDWGLERGVHVQPTVYGGRLIDPELHVGHYYPSAGHMPGYGRLEIQPPANRRLPQPAESYHKSWSAQSTPQPAQPEVPLYPPPIIVAPQGDYSGQPQNFRHRRPPKFPH
jgi:hypothetical protein